MRNWILLAVLGVAVAGINQATVVADEPATTQPAVTWVAYGEPAKLTDADTVAADKVLADRAAYDGKYVRMTGRITKVCKSEGCWVKLSMPGTVLNVYSSFKCKHEGRLLPLDVVGKDAIVEGTISFKQLSEEDARHIAGTEGKSEEELQQIKGTQYRIETVGPTVLVAVPR